MNLQEYYNFPEGANVTLNFFPHWLVDKTNFLCPANMSEAFASYKGSYIPPLDVSNVTKMSSMFGSCSNLFLLNLSSWNTSNVTDMKNMFYNCSKLTSVDLSGWDTSNVTDMSSMFSSCSKLTSVDLSGWDTSNVTDMSSMFSSCSLLTSLPAMNCSSLKDKNKQPIYNYSDYKELTDLGGFIDMKMSWDNAYGLYRCPNLTYESCINILNGLYDFTGNGVTPSSKEGTLKVHANFLTTVGDEISIGTNKGWKITA